MIDKISTEITDEIFILLHIVIYNYAILKEDPIIS